MAAKKTTATAKGREAVAVAEKTVPRFTVERLRKDCLTLFGVGVTTYDGATHGLNGQFTVDEMKTIINEWRTQEVQ